MLFMLPVVGFSLLAFWRMLPVLFMLTAGIALMTGLSAPNFLTGDTTTPLSMSLGLMLVVYAFLCVALAFLTLFRMGRSRDVVDDEAY